MNEGQPGRLAAALIPAALAGRVLLAAGCGGGPPAAADTSSDLLKIGPWVAPGNPSSPQFQAVLQKCNGG